MKSPSVGLSCDISCLLSFASSRSPIGGTCIGKVSDRKTQESKKRALIRMNSFHWEKEVCALWVPVWFVVFICAHNGAFVGSEIKPLLQRLRPCVHRFYIRHEEYLCETIFSYYGTQLEGRPRYCYILYIQRAEPSNTLYPHKTLINCNRTFYCSPRMVNDCRPLNFSRW